jgi:hypothetical protein
MKDANFTLSITGKCSKHPKYKFLKPPRAKCVACQGGWLLIMLIKSELLALPLNAEEK